MMSEEGSAESGDPIAWTLLILMGMVLLGWLSTPGIFNPIPTSLQGTNNCSKQIVCVGAVPAFGVAWSQAQHLMIFVVPLIIAMFGLYFMKQLTGEEAHDYFETKIIHSRAAVDALAEQADRLRMRKQQKQEQEN